MIRRHGTTAGVYAHASVGCLHVRPVVNLKTEAGVRQFEAIASASADLVLAYGGALSGEHGDGLVRSCFMERMFGPALYQAFRHIKQTFDPHGILNPGKIVDAPPLTASLRYGPAYRAVQPATFFDYSEHGGLPGAVEMCSGLGACRKTLDGTMCPSYMATREEAHSTRGRANVLRLAMSGRIGEAGLGDEGVRQVLDLCLECRACKAECPVGVDVARFKSEFLADYWRRHGTPIRAHMLGHIHGVSRWGSRFAPRVERGRPQPARALDQRAAARDGSAPRAAGMDVAAFHTAVSRAPPARGLSPRRGALQRYVHQLLLTRYRRGGIAGPRDRRARRRARTTRVLRTAADFAGSAGGGPAPGGRQRGPAVSARRARRPDRVPGAQLPVGDQRGCALAAARRRTAPGAEGRRPIGAVRRVPRARMRSGAGAARPRRRARAGAPPRPLPPESDGPPRAGEGPAQPDSGGDGGRSRSRLLRHGGIVRLRARALRRLARHRRAAAAARRARRRATGRSWWRAAPRAGIRSTTSPARGPCTRRN